MRSALPLFNLIAHIRTSRDARYGGYRATCAVANLTAYEATNYTADHHTSGIVRGASVDKFDPVHSPDVDTLRTVTLCRVSLRRILTLCRVPLIGILLRRIL